MGDMFLPPSSSSSFPPYSPPRTTPYSPSVPPSRESSPDARPRRWVQVGPNEYLDFSELRSPEEIDRAARAYVDDIVRRGVEWRYLAWCLSSLFSYFTHELKRSLRMVSRGRGLCPLSVWRLHRCVRD
jgi:hypothetical protein